MLFDVSDNLSEILVIKIFIIVLYADFVFNLFQGLKPPLLSEEINADMKAYLSEISSKAAFILASKISQSLIIVLYERQKDVIEDFINIIILKRIRISSQASYDVIINGLTIFPDKGIPCIFLLFDASFYKIEKIFIHLHINLSSLKL